RLGQALRSRPRLNTEISANNAAVLEQTFQRRLDRIRRNSEPDSLRTAAARDNRRVDPDNFAAQIHQGSAAIARIDRRVGLEVTAETVDAVWPAFRADNSVRHCFLE